ncbi:MAG: hypothetical protein IPJ04_18285 [Candidatus Eisenbacteria bacterium]|nr:hypothetical protein [Candidatus Eisenbacteria bacterium]
MRHTHRHASRAGLAAALLAALLLAPVAPARAQTADGEPETGNGARKLAAYVGCAVSIFLSAGTPALAVALSGCLKIVMDEVEHATN